MEPFVLGANLRDVERPQITAGIRGDDIYDG